MKTSVSINKDWMEEPGCTLPARNTELLIRQKFQQKYERPEKFVMLFIVNAIDFTSKHVVYSRRCHMSQGTLQLLMMSVEKCCEETGTGVAEKLI